MLDYVARVKQDYVDLKGCDLENKERPCNIKRKETSSEASSTRRASEPASKPALVAAYTPGVQQLFKVIFDEFIHFWVEIL